jgi:hypothetical protein
VSSSGKRGKQRVLVVARRRANVFKIGESSVANLIWALNEREAEARARRVSSHVLRKMDIVKAESERVVVLIGADKLPDGYCWC